MLKEDGTLVFLDFGLMSRRGGNSPTQLGPGPVSSTEYSVQRFAPVDLAPVDSVHVTIVEE